jgi:hypothetical protein
VNSLSVGGISLAAERKLSPRVKRVRRPLTVDVTAYSVRNGEAFLEQFVSMRAGVSSNLTCDGFGARPATRIFRNAAWERQKNRGATVMSDKSDICAVHLSATMERIRRGALPQGQSMSLPAYCRPYCRFVADKVGGNCCDPTWSSLH